MSVSKSTRSAWTSGSVISGIVWFLSYDVGVRAAAESADSFSRVASKHWHSPTRSRSSCS